MIHRYIVDKYEKENKDINHFVILGPRKCGKTCALFELKNKYPGTYISFEEKKNEIKENPVLYFENLPSPLYIDDIESNPIYIAIIKIYLERHKDDKVVIACSNIETYYELRKVSASLCLLKMTFLSNAELVNKEYSLISDVNQNDKYDNSNILDKIFFGYLPENIGHDLNKQGMNYVNYLKFLIKDVIMAEDESLNKIEFINFLSYIGENVGEKFDVASTANELGVNLEIVKYWVNILQRTNIIFMTRPYSNENLKRNSFRPKIYFYDTGLLIFLTCKGDYNIFRKSNMKIKALENYVISEWEKSLMYSDIDYSLYYYTDETSKYDLIVKTKSDLYSVNVYPSEKPDIKPFLKTKLFDKKRVLLSKNYLIYTGPSVEKLLENDILIIKMPIGKI